MAFPEIKRVVYENAGLEEVKCQIRFPPILEIETSPAQFQNAVRAEFPYYDLQMSLKLPPGMPVTSQAIHIDPSLGQKSHRFMSEDRRLIVILSRNDITLTSKSLR